MEINFESFIAKYPPETIENANLTRELILGMFSQAEEVIDVNAKIIAYMFGKGYKNTLCTIIPSVNSLKLGFFNGIELNDPEGMLTGSGKIHRHIEIRDFYSQQSYIRFLLNEAFKMWMQRG